MAGGMMEFQSTGRYECLSNITHQCERARGKRGIPQHAYTLQQ